MLSRARCSLPRHVRLASGTVPILRRGRNLTDRYRTLEHARRTESKPAASHPDTLIPARTSTPVRTIAGLVVPEEPRAPTDDECCMSGCAVCVYDLYEEALVAHRDSVAALRSSLSALHIPETEWPAHVRTGTAKETHTASASTTATKSKGAVLGAFEEMELALKEKRDRRAAVEAEKRARGEALVAEGERAGLGLRGVYEGIKWIVFPSRY